ncbi:diacylglycerol kinase family enzyme [Humibacillus xanthopallidus]|uniref:Diacylglycerol kinase family enzyme n=1 Tax=Humibacillus xanthopallidus TaxID=412689 RepID=A0A543PP53_9MICO|nr:diacylglycerol kinase family protein [Humibacillus xanthopallidus]TQN45865.1 diacylglycerol kinase family enzyme [Humibacillus xanthopallidus]
MSDTVPDVPEAPGNDGVPSARRSLTVVYNPVKVDDVDAAKQLVADAAARHGWGEPRWTPTTAEETGEKQGREAVEAGADVVASLGGDGTVRAVASALVGTDSALGLLPGGTGNLLARNLGLPIDSLEDAVETMLSGSDRRIDVGLVRTGDSLTEIGADGTAGAGGRADDPAEGRREGEEVFLVMTGLGLDGEVMAGTNEKVKAVIGWVAYVLAAMRKIFGRGFSVSVAATGGPGESDRPGDRIGRHARTVVIGNCGTLQGGIELMPEARLDDGVLDSVVVAPKGFFGWLSVFADVATRHRSGHKRLDRLRGREFTVLAKEPVETEIDGDPIGERRALAVRVLPDSLVVRVG